jgi:hypothetical protein
MDPRILYLRSRQHGGVYKNKKVLGLSQGETEISMLERISTHLNNLDEVSKCSSKYATLGRFALYQLWFNTVRDTLLLIFNVA